MPDKLYVLTQFAIYGRHSVLLVLGPLSGFL
jgi:hypothetical protein